ncbi:hypothetical protein BS614_08780 [Paenibacillus xylanexedens]|nr:hypothetical protein BS614_08780 [Paenibacillus xylanexedens]
MQKSPLRYPGSKSDLSPYVEKVIHNNDLNGCHLIEPFAGGASISLTLLQKGIVGKVTLLEFDPLVYCFWESVFKYTDQLCEMIEETPITIGVWERFQIYKGIDIPLKNNILELGFAGLFLNRTSFSGILKGGPLGGKEQLSTYKIDCRFNKQKIIETIKFISLFSDRVNVKWGNSLKYLSNLKKKTSQEKTFLYVDPPYYDKGKSLYRKYFTERDHKALYRRLTSLQYPWLLSYDDCPFITYLYSHSKTDLKKQNLFFDYSAGGSKKKQEILISNLEIPPIAHVKNESIII